METPSATANTKPAAMSKEQILSQLPDDLQSIRAPPESPDFHFEPFQEERSFSSRMFGFIGGNPFVAVGLVGVTYFLTSGLRSMVSGDRVRSQRMMRGRILSQSFVCVSLVTGLLLHSAMKGDDHVERHGR